MKRAFFEASSQAGLLLEPVRLRRRLRSRGGALEGGCNLLFG